MPRFILLGNRPHAEDGNTIRPGEEFDSPRELDVLFANKFKRVGGKTKKQRDFDRLPDEGGKVMDRAPHDQINDEDDPVITDRSVVKGRKAGLEEDEYEADPKPKKKAKKPEPDSEEEAEAGDEGPEAEDVTDQFPKAEDAGFKVMKDQDGCYLVCGSDDRQLNEEAFHTKKDVNKFLKDHQGE